MRVAALVCALALLVSPYFFAYCEVERLLGWPQPVYRWFDPWLPLAMILVRRSSPSPCLGLSAFSSTGTTVVTNPNL